MSNKHPHPDDRAALTTLTTITYVLSHLSGVWHVHRYDDIITVIRSGIPMEQEALEIALHAANQDRPSRVVRIAQNGEYEVVASFIAED